jgi:hypothetical protein
VIWVLVFAGIAVVGFAMLVGYAVWLAHKTADVASEVAQLGSLAGRLGALLAEIHPPGSDDREPSSFRSDVSPTT